MEDAQSPLAAISDDKSAERPENIPYALTIPLLVALAAAASDDKQRSYPTDHSQLDHETVRQQPTNERLERVLDALAALSVSRPQKQAIAIGVQITATNLILTIADNQPVEDDTINHLKNVWSTLQQLSNAYARQNDTHIGRSPNPPRSTIAADLRRKLAAQVYAFTSGKNLRQWAKLWDPIDGAGLLAFYRTVRARKGPRLYGLTGQFEFMVVKMSIALKAMRDGDDANWEEVVGYMGDATDIADSLLGDGDWCERLAVELMALSRRDQEIGLMAGGPLPLSSAPPMTDSAPQPATEPFALRRHIENLTAHHRYYRALHTSARSRTLRPAFTLTISVEPVAVSTKTPARDITIPTSAESWANVLQHLSERHHLTVNLACATPLIAHLVNRHGHSAPIAYSVHPECALIAYYDSQRALSNTYTPPLPYIGSSKPPCHPCQMWFEEYSSRPGRPKFSTRGGSGGWCYPWSPPFISGRDSALEDELQMACVARLRQTGVLTSGVYPNAETTWEDDDEERAERTRQAKLMMRIIEGI